MIMGIKARAPRIRLGKGKYLRFGKKGVTYSSKHGVSTRTTNLRTGETANTIRTPIKGVSYQMKSGKGKPINTTRRYSPRVYKIVGIIALIVGVIGLLTGIPTVKQGGLPLLIIGFIGLGLGVFYIRLSKNRQEDP